MEVEGCKRAFAFLKDACLCISSFISDRHRGIAKWIRETQAETQHFHDLWHIGKIITKNIFSAGKEKGCEIILRWCKGIRSHLFWCALSTNQGFGDLIVAKWKSIVRHIANKHDDHPNVLYKKCAHGDIDKRDYFKIGVNMFNGGKYIISYPVFSKNLISQSPHC